MRSKVLGLISLAVALVLQACTTSDTTSGRYSGVIGDEGGVCSPERTTPLRLTSEPTDVGLVALSMDGTGIRVNVTPAPGYEIGDVYVGLGPDIQHIHWFIGNPEPWNTGYVASVDIEAGLEEAEIVCNGRFKFILQAYVRHVGVTERLFASAVGDSQFDPPIWGWYQFDDVCCMDSCTYTQGYWKNHEENWPVDSLVLGDNTYTQAQLLAIWSMPVRRDASINLAHQLAAALLNSHNGAPPPTAIADAQSWLSAYGSRRVPLGVHPSSIPGQVATSIASRLAAYNEGATGPGHCGD